MKQTTVVAGVLAAVLLFGSALAGWASDGEKDGGGIFTLTDIPAEYHGKYALLYADYDDSTVIVGANEVPLFVAIRGERVDFPLWFVISGGFSINVDTYSGNDTRDVNVSIFHHERASDLEDAVICFTLEAVTFTNGNATASWHDGTFADE
jgi:hypothetical protein